MGILWAPMLPIAQLLVLVFIFRRIVPLNIEAYPAFVFSALLPWTWFSNCLSSAGHHFINNRDLMRRADFAPAMIVVVNAISHLISFLLVLPLLFVVLVSYQRAITAAVALLPLLLFLQGLLTVGLSLMVATLNVFYRDIAHAVALSLLLLFYLTPVFYEPQTAGGILNLVFVANPLALLVQGYRAIFHYGRIPDLNLLLLAAVISVVVCSLGYLVYRRKIHDVIDMI